MSAELKAELQIPDLWYDFYARLLPGTAFAVAVRCFVLHNIEVPSAAEMVVLAGAGYFSALLTQPLASRLTRALERAVECLRSKDRHYIGAVQGRLGVSSRSAMILSKMHGEIAFAQLAILSAVFGLLERAQFLPFVLSAFSLAAAIEVADRRLQRAMDYEHALNNVPASSNAPAAS